MYKLLASAEGLLLLLCHALCHRQEMCSCATWYSQPCCLLQVLTLVSYIVSNLVELCNAPQTGDVLLPGTANHAVCCECQLASAEAFLLLLCHVTNRRRAATWYSTRAVCGVSVSSQ